MTNTPEALGIELVDLHKTYERTIGRDVVRTRALRGVELRLAPKEFVSLIGPSGCGKTTVLKIISGLVRPTSGSVRMDGRAVAGPSSDRATVFQEPRLMPWKTVLGNVLLALEFAGIEPSAVRMDRAHEYLGLVGLSDFESHYPGELSGGMQQRVGIARALALEPDLFLMDEPFGALDAITRHTMQAELLEIWEQERKSVLFVTHSIEEALLLSDRVVVMKDGQVVADHIVPIDRPRTRQHILEDPHAQKLRLELEAQL